MAPIQGIEQNNPYLLGKLGGITTHQPRVAPVSTGGNEYGISMPGQVGYVADEGGNRISQGQDGVGLAHRDPKEYGFMVIC